MGRREARRVLRHSSTETVGTRILTGTTSRILYHETWRIAGREAKPAAPRVSRSNSDRIMERMFGDGIGGGEERESLDDGRPVPEEPSWMKNGSGTG